MQANSMVPEKTQIKKRFLNDVSVIRKVKPTQHFGENIVSLRDRILLSCFGKTA